MIDTQEEKPMNGSSSDDVQQVKPEVQSNAIGGIPSASSSPSHEFSFTISLHQPAAAPDRNKILPAALAVDLTPADEIFFQGHLLPLHLLSHLPVSPRSSTNSLDSFTLPINDLLQHNNDNDNDIKIDSIKSDDEYTINGHSNRSNQEASLLEPQPRRKAKSFSLFGLPKWMKGNEVMKRDHHNQDEDKKRKSKLDIGHILKRYIRLVNPFLFHRNRRGNPQIHMQQPYSFSGNLQMKNNKVLRGRRGEFSAPGSMRTSPTNSGRLVASGTVTPTTSESTMEELQAAIQAAIAHCKKSIAAAEDKRSNCHS